MATSARRWRLAGLILLAVVFGFGCDFGPLAYFLVGGEAMKDPEFMSLAPDKKKDKDREESKVVIVSYSALDMRAEFIGVDRDLCQALAQQLKKGFTANKEKVTLVPASQVEAYKDRHPEWRTQRLEEIGEYFHADYVIYLELRSLSFYERGSGNTLYSGRANLHLELADVHDPSSNPLYQAEPVYDYPRGHPIDTTDMPPRRFRLDFVNHMARQLSWYFTAHPAADDITCD
jgi:hypothetical protein